MSDMSDLATNFVSVTPTVATLRSATSVGMRAGLRRGSSLVPMLDNVFRPSNGMAPGIADEWLRAVTAPVDNGHRFGRQHLRRAGFGHHATAGKVAAEGENG
ncbi:hypothetical protein MB901379_02482 [Mycobacterium basiliense]|uniref:Uncharacterized protein n=1 Tax=Mycobacterium basiliense TaxID=2094119 RepID=A0A447GEN4_9MYCO|nr:hypothetical protein MB901379_02482 [Mycobacterium basiliense]